MILLYANEHEVRYIDYEPKICIGLGAIDLEKYAGRIKTADKVLLFGCSGWTGSRFDLSDFISWAGDDRAVDMESHIVHTFCYKNDIPFNSIRYIIDYDRGRVMPRGINHFWRKYQHRRMQLKFNKWLKENYK